MIAVGFCLGVFGATYAQVREVARLIDDLGFDSVWVWDHYVSWNDPREPVLECWTTLAGLAEATRRVWLGPLVANNTNRHPGRLAKVAATLQEVSGGRCELGLGAGGYEDEQIRFGIDQGAAGRRVGQFEEALQIIPAIWSGEPTTFAGRYYQLRDAIAAPAPDPRPRIIVGAHGSRMIGLAARYADGLNLNWKRRDQFPQMFAALDAGLAEAGRTRAGFDLSLHPYWRDLAPDPARALAEWERMGFTRALVYVSAPFPLHELEKVARVVQG